MTEIETYSWILLAIHLGSEKERIDYAGIKSIADGINHAVPSDKEMQSSLKHLIVKGLVDKTGNKYTLTKQAMSRLFQTLVVIFCIV